MSIYPRPSYSKRNSSVGGRTSRASSVSRATQVRPSEDSRRSTQYTQYDPRDRSMSRTSRRTSKSSPSRTKDDRHSRVSRRSSGIKKKMSCCEESDGRKSRRPSTRESRGSLGLGQFRRSTTGTRHERPSTRESRGSLGLGQFRRSTIDARHGRPSIRASRGSLRLGSNESLTEVEISSIDLSKPGSSKRSSKSTKQTNKKDPNDPCVCGPDIYTKVLGPTADETILVGIQTIFDLCEGFCDPNQTKKEGEDSKQPGKPNES